ncbi:MAG: amidohydrolase family protein [Solobacterium sp.]|nr:amidohydrolase family protein [Solobacterium sp.]
MRERKVIDLCLDMPMQAHEMIATLSHMCLDPSFRGYKTAYAPGIAAQAGLDIAELDRILEEKGEEAWIETVRAGAEKNAVTPAKFVEYLDSINVAWGITCDSTHDNAKTAEIVHAFPDRFKGFIFVDPNKGMEAVRELEKGVKDYGLHALYLTAFRTHLPANDKKNYPLYAKACELGIPVHIYSSLNLSKEVPYDIGHPRYIDEVARDFPELKIMAGVSGWPWVLDFISLAYRHQNVYLNFETHEPRKMNMRGSGYEPYLFYAETQLKNRLCFASNWTTQSISVDDLVKQVEDLPLQPDTIDRILYDNAAEFYR